MKKYSKDTIDYLINNIHIKNSPYNKLFVTLYTLIPINFSLLAGILISLIGNYSETTTAIIALLTIFTFAFIIFTTSIYSIMSKTVFKPFTPTHIIYYYYLFYFLENEELTTILDNEDKINILLSHIKYKHLQDSIKIKLAEKKNLLSIDKIINDKLNNTSSIKIKAGFHEK